MLEEIMKTLNKINEKNRSYLRLLVYVFNLSILITPHENINSIFGLFEEISIVRIFLNDALLNVYLNFSLIMAFILFLNSTYGNERMAKKVKELYFHIQKSDIYKEKLEYNNYKRKRPKKAFKMIEHYRMELKVASLHREGKMLSLIDSFNCIIIAVILIIKIYSFSYRVVISTMLLLLLLLFWLSRQSQKLLVKEIKDANNIIDILEE